ncbi:MAG: hypothetical protein ACLSVD_16615 [Eggerthellaceae bacterium]
MYVDTHPFGTSPPSCGESPACCQRDAEQQDLQASERRTIMGFIEEQQLESAYVMGTPASRWSSWQARHAGGGWKAAYLDFVSGVGAVSLGHCHPALASAIEQASTSSM